MRKFVWTVIHIEEERRKNGTHMSASDWNRVGVSGEAEGFTSCQELGRGMDKESILYVQQAWKE